MEALKYELGDMIKSERDIVHDRIDNLENTQIEPSQHVRRGISKGYE